MNEKEIFKGNYVVICHKTFEKNISSFPDLYFYSKEMNYAFILLNRELFSFYNTQIYFLNHL